MRTVKTILKFLVVCRLACILFFSSSVNAESIISDTVNRVEGNISLVFSYEPKNDFSGELSMHMTDENNQLILQVDESMGGKAEIPLFVEGFYYRPWPVEQAGGLNSKVHVVRLPENHVLTEVIYGVEAAGPNFPRVEAYYTVYSLDMNYGIIPELQGIRALFCEGNGNPAAYEECYLDGSACIWTDIETAFGNYNIQFYGDEIQVGRGDYTIFPTFFEADADGEELLNLWTEVQSELPPAKEALQQGSASAYSENDLSSEAGISQGTNALSPYQSIFTQSAEFKIDLGETKETVFPNAYAAYLNVVTKCIEQYGETGLTEGPVAAAERFIGLSFLDLIDFDQNGTEELLLVFFVKDYGYIFNVWDYDGQRAVLLTDGTGLYGTNGGMSTVYLIHNAFGTYMIRGSADDFEYNYYYGYAGQEFGLVKYLGCDETGIAGNYTIDGNPVSMEEWSAALAEWGSTTESQEKYLLTPYNEDEKSRTWLVINETMQKLQQYAETEDSDVVEQEDTYEENDDEIMPESDEEENSADAEEPQNIPAGNLKMQVQYGKPTSDGLLETFFTISYDRSENEGAPEEAKNIALTLSVSEGLEILGLSAPYEIEAKNRENTYVIRLHDLMDKQNQNVSFRVKYIYSEGSDFPFRLGFPEPILSITADLRCDNAKGCTYSCEFDTKTIPRMLVIGDCPSGEFINDIATNVRFVQECYEKLYYNGRSVEVTAFDPHDMGEGCTFMDALSTVESWETDENDVTYIYINAHGFRDAQERRVGKEYIAVPYFSGTAESGDEISYEDVLRYIDEHVKGHVVIMTEICYSGIMIDIAKEMGLDEEKFTLITATNKYSSAGEMRGFVTTNGFEIVQAAGKFTLCVVNLDSYHHLGNESFFESVNSAEVAGIPIFYPSFSKEKDANYPVDLQMSCSVIASFINPFFSGSFSSLDLRKFFLSGGAFIEAVVSDINSYADPLMTGSSVIEPVKIDPQLYGNMNTPVQIYRKDFDTGERYIAVVNESMKELSEN